MYLSIYTYIYVCIYVYIFIYIKYTIKNKMIINGTFAEPATLDYRLSFAIKENKQKLPFSISSVLHLRNFGNMETLTWRHGH